MKLKTILIVLSNGYLMDSTGTLLPDAQKDGAVQRFLEMSRGRSPHDCYVVHAGGYTPASPSVPTKEVNHPLSIHFKTWLDRDMLGWEPTFRAATPVWSHRREIYSCFQEIRQNIIRSSLPHEVVIGTSASWFHQARVKIYGWLFKPKGWKVTVVRSTHDMGDGANFKEILKWGDALLTVFTSLFGWKRVG